MILILLSILFIESSHSKDNISFEERLSYLLKEYKSNQNGPNCWSSVLFLSGLSPTIAFSSDEIQFWLTSPLCKEIKKDFQRGDIFDISSTIHTPILPAQTVYTSNHSFVYLSDNNFLTKNGIHQDEPYKVSSLQDLLSQYAANPEGNKDINCSHISSEQALKQGCEDILKAYRCESIDKVLGKSSQTLKQDYSTFIDTVNCVNTEIFSDNSTNNFEKEIESLILPIKKMALNKLGYNDLSVNPTSVRNKLKNLILEEDEFLNEDEIQDKLELYFIYSRFNSITLNKKTEEYHAFQFYKKATAPLENISFEDSLLYAQMFFSSRNIIHQFSEDSIYSWITNYNPDF